MHTSSRRKEEYQPRIFPLLPYQKLTHAHTLTQNRASPRAHTAAEGINIVPTKLFGDKCFNKTLTNLGRAKGSSPRQTKIKINAHSPNDRRLNSAAASCLIYSIGTDQDSVRLKALRYVPKSVNTGWQEADREPGIYRIARSPNYGYNHRRPYRKQAPARAGKRGGTPKQTIAEIIQYSQSRTDIMVIGYHSPCARVWVGGWVGRSADSSLGRSVGWKNKADSNKPEGNPRARKTQSSLAFTALFSPRRGGRN